MRMRAEMKRATIAAFTLLALVALLSSLLAIAAPVKPPATPDATAKPKPPPIVNVKKLDGSVVHGQLVSADGASVSVKPSAEPGKYGDAVDIQWSEIKSVSNGLTQAKAKAAWKAEHHDDLCDTCHGDRLLPCSVCKGTGHDPASSKDCKTCKGAGTVKCKEPRCDNGMVPCLGPCIKLTEGTWSKPDADGKRWRHFGGGKHGGGMLYSHLHAGEIVQIEKDGSVSGTTPCTICGKTGKVFCPTCGGRGVVACPTCKADKSAADCKNCEDGTELCSKCNGSGLKTPAPKKVEAPATPENPANAKPTAPTKPKPESKGNDGLD